MITADKIRSLAESILPEMTALRQDFHQIPEIAGKEFKTSAKIRQFLADLPLEVRKPYLQTDVCALLNGDSAGPNITLRADIDALPIAELNRFPYISTHPGMMHACGHDGHMAMLCGAVKILCALRDELPAGSVRFVFQPGEEVQAMARDLVRAGVLESPKADFVAAIHGWPGVQHGCISTRVGTIMAANVHFTLKILGKGGHSGKPELARSPICAGAKIVERLRLECPPVCSVCMFHAGDASNVIPDTAEILGTTRFLTDGQGAEIERVFRTVTEEVCREFGVNYDLDYHNIYRPVVNSEFGKCLAQNVAERYLGGKNFVEREKSDMSSEDFCFFLQKCDGVYCHLGLGEHAALHTANFDFDDSILLNGMIFLAGLAHDFLTEKASR